MFKSQSEDDSERPLFASRSRGRRPSVAGSSGRGAARSRGRCAARSIGRRPSVARSRGRCAARSIGRCAARSSGRGAARSIGRRPSVTGSGGRGAARSRGRGAARSIGRRPSVARSRSRGAVRSIGRPLQAMLQLPRTQTLEEMGGKGEGEGEGEGEASETKSKVHNIYMLASSFCLSCVCGRAQTENHQPWSNVSNYTLLTIVSYFMMSVFGTLLMSSCADGSHGKKVEEQIERGRRFF